MAEQLSLDFPMRSALGREDFVVSACNQMAVAVLDDAALWPNGKLVLSGAAGAGKTHLAHVWAHDVSAQIFDADALSDLDIYAIAVGPMVVEDIDRIAGQPDNETALFHLHNVMAAAGHLLLMTSQTAPAHLPIGLPDLRSRLEATTLVTLEAIDDMLLTMLLVKLFTDRQLVVEPAMLDYTVPRIERSFDAVQKFVEQIDRRALASKRKPGMALAREILTEMTAE
jgi:chromosomal replication initiation ATPase DnaA